MERDLERWQRVSRIAIESDSMVALRTAIRELATAPHVEVLRQRVRAIATDGGLELALPSLLIAEAYAGTDAETISGLRAETERAYVAIGESQTADDDPADRDRIAFSSYLVGDWVQCAELLVELSLERSVEQALVYLRAAGRLYRNTGHNDHAMNALKLAVHRRPSDVETLTMVATLINSPQVVPFTIAPPTAPVEEEIDGGTILGFGFDDRRPAPPSAQTARIVMGVPHAPVFDAEDSELDERLSKAFADDAPLPPRAKTEPVTPRASTDGTGAANDDFDADSIPAPIAPDVSLPTVSPIAANVIGIARAYAANGDVAGAERRLREFNEAQPRALAGHIALVQILVNDGRAADAIGYLRKLLERPDLRPEHRGALVHSRALVTIGIEGSTDATHAMFRQAHELDGKSISLGLAYGASCYARKEWEIAEQVLGSLANHPRATRRAPMIARALVHAAIAALRQTETTRAALHCESALKLDPHNGPAIRLLAMIEAEHMKHADDDLDGATVLDDRALD